MSMLSDFLNTNGITPEALLAASKAIEKLNSAQRDLATKRTAARRDKKPYADLNLAKPTGLGRGLSPETIHRAMQGQPVPRLVRKKIVRAVNAKLASAKKDAIDWRPLFGDAKLKTGKKAKK